MTGHFDLNVVDEVMALAVGTDEFREFCDNLDMLDALYADDPFTEAVKDPSVERKKTGGKILKNTVKTTKDVASVYGSVTDAGGAILKTAWDIFFGALKLIIKIIAFVLNKIAIISKAIASVASKVAAIPGDIRNKIRGNIKLYITYDDVETLYNQSLLRNLDEFIVLAEQLSTGSTWSTFFNRRKIRDDDGNGHEFTINANDVGICKKMRGLYSHVKSIEFEETVVEMSKDEVRKIYFSGEKSLTFTDLRGNQHQGTYYDALSQLLTDLQKRSKGLGAIQKLLGQKYDESMMNKQFVSLPKPAQNLITETIQMVSKIVNIVGNIIKYVTQDLNTIQKSAEKILASKKSKSEEPQQEAPTTA